MRAARLLALAAPVLLSLGLAPAPAHAAKPPACSKVKGKNLVPKASLRVVDVPRRRGGRTVHRYYACPTDKSEQGRAAKVLKASRVGGALRFLDGNGAYAAVHDVSAKRVFIHDLPTRKRYSRFPSPTGTVLVGEAGEAMTVRGGKLVGYDFDGRSAVIDRGPVASLRRKDDVASWTAAGKSKQLAFSRMPVPCARQGGDAFKRNGVRITRFDLTGEDFDGELSSTVTRTRACLLEGDPTPVVLGQTAGPPSGSIFSVGSTAAPFVVTHETYEGSESNVTETIGLTDLRTGESSRVFESSKDAGVSLISDVFVIPNGTIAMASQQFDEEFYSVGVKIFARRIDGSIRELDAAGSSSEFTGRDGRITLKLSGTTLSWKRNGQAKSADLAG